MAEPRSQRIRPASASHRQRHFASAASPAASCEQVSMRACEHNKDKSARTHNRRARISIHPATSLATGRATGNLDEGGHDKCATNAFGQTGGRMDGPADRRVGARHARTHPMHTPHAHTPPRTRARHARTHAQELSRDMLRGESASELHRETDCDVAAVLGDVACPTSGQAPAHIESGTGPHRVMTEPRPSPGGHRTSDRRAHE